MAALAGGGRGGERGEDEGGARVWHLGRPRGGRRETREGFFSSQMRPPSSNILLLQQIRYFVY
jgi:hypothetical protein